MRHTTIALILHGVGFRDSNIDPKIVESYLEVTDDDCIVFKDNEYEYMTFTEQHPMFNVVTLQEGAKQIYASGVNRGNNDYYAICDIIEKLYQKATKI